MIVVKDIEYDIRDGKVSIAAELRAFIQIEDRENLSFFQKRILITAFAQDWFV